MQHVAHRRSDEIAQLHAEIERLRAVDAARFKLFQARNDEIERLRAVLKRIATSNVNDMNTLHNSQIKAGPVDIVERIRSAIHLESAAIAPQTSALIEAARAGVAEIERYRSIATEYSRKSAEAEKTIERLRGAMPSTFTLEEPARAIEERGCTSKT
jgi:flagellin-like hook-associated protein FlgL